MLRLLATKEQAPENVLFSRVFSFSEFQRKISFVKRLEAAAKVAAPGWRGATGRYDSIAIVG